MMEGLRGWRGGGGGLACLNTVLCQAVRIFAYSRNLSVGGREETDTKGRARAVSAQREGGRE